MDRRIAGCAVLALALVAGAWRPSGAASSTVTVPRGAFFGMHATGPADPQVLLHLAIELQPRGDLDGLAAKMSDPTDPAHRQTITAQGLSARFGRLPETRALGRMLHTAGASDIYVAEDGLVAGGLLHVDQAERFFHAHWLRYTDGTHVVLAPAGPLTVPFANARDVRGAVVATIPRLADTRPSFTYFRGDWYEPSRFRDLMQAVPNGGVNERIVLVEDASDRVDLNDAHKLLFSDGAPAGASAELVTERSFVFKSASGECGRDDRGQEAAIDVGAAVTMAPAAAVQVDYDDACSGGNDGTLALARALDQSPTVIVFPFAVGPVDTTIADRYGLTPLPQLEAIVRGIPLVVPSGDDGAYGYREPGIEKPRVIWPCVSPYVICAGGTQLGDRDGVIDEAPWNDLDHAGGGGISNEPRPRWQDAPGDYLFSPQYVKNRVVPDVSADAAGHLRVFWHGYGIGGVGGTSESAAIVGGALAAINSLVPPQKRLASVGDLYVLAKTAPEAFRDVQRENDRGWKDNTLRPRRVPLPKDYVGLVPTPAPLVRGCSDLQPDGCTVTKGFDAVTGIGSLLEKPAVAALKS
ncbi:MAG TPA: protease pro-enzyme activation domain-containing protein [Candidatus Sulfotelmatobacter sp.]|nr:protease pro-enzyme activation domain-containing protein [Candidatus Sulfotelmatobacter sp.]